MKSHLSLLIPLLKKPRINGKEVEIANYDDYNVLYKSKDIEMGYGVLYGDDAEETLSDINEIYGYRYGSSGTYGMRGCFIYNMCGDAEI
mgnify:CR=1 FL=1